MVCRSQMPRCRPGTPEIRKKRPSPRAPELPSHSDLAVGVNAVDLEHSLRKIRTNRGNLYGGRLLSLWCY